MAGQLVQPGIEKEALGALPLAKPPVESVVRGLATDDQVLLTKLLIEPVDFVHDDRFADPGIEEDLFGSKAVLAEARATRFAPPAPMPGLEEAGRSLPTLSHEDETFLFLRFNYARKRVAEILTRFAGKRLTAQATRLLLAWGHRVIECRGMIVRINLPLVLAMAKRTKLTGLDFNELISEGNMALLRSVEKFDCSRGFKFSTYACRAILKSFSRVAMRASRYRSHFPTEFDANLERSDYLTEKRDELENDCVDELKQILLKNLANLSDVERTVINERFAIRPALPGEPKPAPKTLEQVGEIIGVTKERVRQIQNKALRKIRTVLEERYLAA